MDPDQAPHVVIVGGVLTEPLQYRPLRDRLLGRGAASVTIAPIHVVDWMAAGVAGLGPLLLRTGLTILRTHRRTGARPLLIVGHSGGGILARLALSPVPFQGRVVDARRAVGGLVTLGTPHGLASAPVRWRHPGVAAAAFLDSIPETAPGDPEVAFLTVGSTAVPPLAWHTAPRISRLLDAPFRALVGPVGAGGGDGIVGVGRVHLAGAPRLTFPDVTHGTVGPRWYGDEAIVDRWWPAALEAWSGALRARTGGTSSAAAGVVLDR